MQKKTWTRAFASLAGAAAIAVGVISYAPLAGAAQDQHQNPPAEGRFGGPRRGGPGGPGGRGGRFGGGPMALGLDPRDLTDAQRDQIKAIHERHAASMKPIMDQVQAARKALDDNILAGGGNARALALEVGKAEGDLAFANAQIQTEILAVLTPEQRQKMQQRRQEMETRRKEMQSQRQQNK
jgi:Spy/CpxP family protein refolding chaperone